MLPSEPYLYHAVMSISNVLKFTQIKLITNNHYYVIVKTGQADNLKFTPKITKLSSVAIFLQINVKYLNCL